MLYLAGRLSPYEWRSPHPCKRSDDILENQFTLFNAFWFVMCNIMHQGMNCHLLVFMNQSFCFVGTDINPVAPSTRMISCLWAFCTLILVSSYTANLGKLKWNMFC